MTLPVAITSDGNFKAFYTPTVADPTAPTVTECTSSSGFDATCYLTGDGWAPSTDESVVIDSRACSRQTFEDLGRYTDKLQVKYIYRQQDPTSPTNKAFTVWKRGTTGYLIVRYGTAFEPDVAAANIVDVIPITCDVQQKQTIAENEKQKIMQNMRITGPVQRDVAVVA